MHSRSTTLGSVIKSARKRSDLTIEELADRVKMSERYLYRIENEGKKPSYDVLYTIIRTLAISPDDLLSRKTVERFRDRKSRPTSP